MTSYQSHPNVSDDLKVRDERCLRVIRGFPLTPGLWGWAATRLHVTQYHSLYSLFKVIVLCAWSHLQEHVTCTLAIACISVATCTYVNIHKAMDF